MAQRVLGASVAGNPAVGSESTIRENYGGLDNVRLTKTGGGAGGGDAVNEFLFQKRKQKRREMAKKGAKGASRKLGEAEEVGLALHPLSKCLLWQES